MLTLAAAGCAREGGPVAMVPAAPLQTSLLPKWQLPPRLARIPRPVAPYVWPDPEQPLPKLVIPRWAGTAAAPYATTVQRAALYYQLPPELIWAVIKVESNFDPRALSPANAHGLMQLIPSTAERMMVQDIYDPRQNIFGGTRYLRVLANLFNGDLQLTVAAYNAGENAVIRHGGIPPYAETQRYVVKVLEYYRQYREQEALAVASR